MKLNHIKRPPLKRAMKLVIGWLFFLVGLITAPLPIPLGQLVALIGLSLLISESRMMRKFTQKIRRNYPRLDQMMEKVKPYLPAFLKNTIDETHPRHLYAISVPQEY